MDNIDIVIKIVAILASLFTTTKIFIIIINLRKDNFKKDFEIALKYLDGDLEKKHDYLVEIGYSAITGKKLDASLIRYFLSKDDPLQKLSMYHYGMKYIKTTKNFEKKVISLDLLDEINDDKKLKIKRIKIIIPYIIYSLLGFLPFIFLNDIVKLNIEVLFIFCVPFIFFAGVQLYEAIILNKAKELCDKLNYLE